MEHQVSFEATKEEFALVRKIVGRALGLGLVNDRTASTMDMVACNANGCPVDFARMLAADDFNFTHDFCGIARHIDRETGRIAGHFSPRFSKRLAA